MSVFTIIWKTIQAFMYSRAFKAAVEIALEVIPQVEEEAKANPDWTWRDKHQRAFDLVEEQLKELGYHGARYVFVAIELALDHLGYFQGKSENVAK